MTADQVIALARKHRDAGMPGSARACLADALVCRDRGDLFYAKQRALNSLRYSVGVFHADYVRASA
jgi:hypothetical protein